MSIQRELDQMRLEFESLPDGFARYSYLVELAALLPPPSEELRREEHRFRGCQSQVWLRAWVERGRARLEADSDALILRGVLALYWGLLDGCPVEEALAADFDLLGALNIGEHFNSSRTAGITGLLPAIQEGLRHGL